MSEFMLPFDSQNVRFLSRQENLSFDPLHGLAVTLTNSASEKNSFNLGTIPDRPVHELLGHKGLLSG